MGVVQPGNGTPSGRAGGARTVVLSQRGAERFVWQASQYEFEDVVSAVDDVRLLAPSRARDTTVGRTLNGVLNRGRKAVGRPRRRGLLPVADATDSDLFFGVFAAPNEIAALPHVRAHVERARRRVAFVVELWVPQLPGVRDHLRQLRGFDHVFVFNRDALPAVRDLTGAPVSYLPTAVDADLFCPSPGGPARTIDVMSYGRRLEGTHAALLDAMSGGELHYLYDTVRGPFEVTGHREHRMALAAALQRSRYGVVYKNNDEPGRTARTGGEESLTNRYFETLAAGAVMLGSAPDVADFAACFPWPDAVVPIPAPDPDVRSVLASLDAEPERVAVARLAGVTTSLRRHDWAHRWREVLDAVDLPELPALSARLDALEDRAGAHEAAAATRA